MGRLISAILIVFVGSLSLSLGAYPASYQVGYGFVNHGGIGPHGHYLPAVARVKVHKDPFMSHYSLDEEGPTHYKYVRHSSPTIHHPPPPPPLVDHHHLSHHHGHHHHGHVAAIAAPPVHIHGGVIAAAAPAAIPVSPVGFGGGHIYDDYGYGHAALLHGGLGAYY